MESEEHIILLERIRSAIIKIHIEADYYTGLDELCKIVGWGSFRCEGLYPAKEMHDWVLKQRGNAEVLKFPEQFKQPEQSVKKKRGWPKGRPRKPRHEQETETQVEEEVFLNWKQM